MTSTGGYVEQKTIGISIGTGGTFTDTEIVDGKIQLTKTSSNPDVFSKEGEWISSVVNIGDNFKSYGKIFITETEVNNSSTGVSTKTSSDGINFNEWTPVSIDNDILSVKNRYIMVKINLFAGFEETTHTVLPSSDMHNGNYIVEDISGNIKLKRDYEFDMTLDETWTQEGSLHRELIARSDWLRIDRLEVIMNG